MGRDHILELSLTGKLCLGGLIGQSGHLWSQHQLYHPSPILDAICGNIYETILPQTEPLVPEMWPPTQQVKQDQWCFFKAQGMSCKRYIEWFSLLCNPLGKYSLRGRYRNVSSRKRWVVGLHRKLSQVELHRNIFSPLPGHCLTRISWKHLEECSSCAFITFTWNSDLVHWPALVEITRQPQGNLYIHVTQLQNTKRLLSLGYLILPSCLLSLQIS